MSQLTGVGVAAQDLPHLFERFYRAAGTQGRSAEGAGIGLALVQSLVEMHGGTARGSTGNPAGSSASRSSVTASRAVGRHDPSPAPVTAPPSSSIAVTGRYPSVGGTHHLASEHQPDSPPNRRFLVPYMAVGPSRRLVERIDRRQLNHGEVSGWTGTRPPDDRDRDIGRRRG